jgi:hypothetical protein
MIKWLGFKDNTAATHLHFENLNGSKLKIMIDIDDYDNIKCNMNFFKNDKIIDISKLNSSELAFFLRVYEDHISSFKRKLKPFNKLKLDLRVIRNLIRIKRFSNLFFIWPMGSSLFGFKKLYTIDGSNGFCFAASFFKNLHMLNVLSPKISNQYLPYLHILNVRYLNNFYDEEIKYLSEIIKRIIIYIRLLNVIIYFPLTFFLFHQHEIIIQHPLGLEAISFYISLVEIPIVWMLVPIFFNYLLKKTISKYIIKL